MTVEYDPAVLQDFAERLYKQARSIAVTSAIRAFILGGIVGAIVLQFVHQATSSIVAFIGFGTVAGILSFSSGWEKSFQLRLEAQRALCALQTEVNTRSSRTLPP